MAGGNEIRAGRAFVELGTKDTALMKGLKAAQKRIANFGRAVQTVGLGMAGIGGTIAGAMAVAAKGFADSGSALNDMAGRTGMSVEALSELGYAAKQTGADSEALETGVRKMQRTIGEAAGGSKSAADALTVWG